MVGVPSKLEEWSLETIRLLVEAHALEDSRFDWKRELPRNQEGKDRLVREAVAMANGGGAFIILGVSDRGAPAERIRGILPDPELNHKIQGQFNRADPAIPFLLKNPPIAIAESNLKIHVIQILSFSSPHSFQGTFYRRTSGGSAQPMTTGEVREQFVRSGEAIREAPVLHEIKKLHHELRRCVDWEQRAQKLELLDSYAEEGSARVRYEVLRALDGLSPLVRDDMPGWFAWGISDIILSVMRSGPEPRREVNILLHASEHGFSLAYDGALYLQNGPVVWAGAEVLGRALAIARKYELPTVEARAREHFATAMDAAARARPVPFQDAIEWLRYRERAALAGGEQRLHPPVELERRIMTLDWDDEQETHTRRKRWKQRLLDVSRWLRLPRGR